MMLHKYGWMPGVAGAGAGKRQEYESICFGHLNQTKSECLPHIQSRLVSVGLF